MEKLVNSLDQNMFGQIDFESVKLGLEKDEMEEIVGGYGGSGGFCAVMGALAIIGGGTPMFWSRYGGAIRYCWNS